jgi:DNA-binding PucR family transcriptional regulator
VPTLRVLLDLLGPAVNALTGAAGLDAEVSEVLLVGPGDPLPDNPAALLVCVEHEGLLERGVKAAGVVVKLQGSDPTEWTNAPLPVLAADDTLPWQHLLQLLTTATSAVGSNGGVGDLFALANSVAAMVGGAVAIEDPQRRVLAYSSLPDQPIDQARQQGILGRQVPDLSRNDSIYRKMQRSPGVVRIPSDGDILPRLAVAVRSGAELLGSIWVVESKRLPQESDQALLDAGRLAALHLLRARAGVHVERRARGELLRGLLDGRSSTELAAARLGIEVVRPVAVLGFSLPEQTAADELDADAVADLVQLQCSVVRPRSSVLVQLGTVYVLVPAHDVSRQRLVQLAAAVVDRARAALRVELTAGVGATVASLHEVGRSRADVDAVLRLGPPGSVAAVEDVLPQVALLDLQAHFASAPHLRLPAVDRMLAHDAEQGTPYAESVLAYLAANADVPAAAESVNVHANTFRYRMRRVKELFALDLEDPDVRLVTWLQLRARS